MMEGSRVYVYVCMYVCMYVYMYMCACVGVGLCAVHAVQEIQVLPPCLRLALGDSHGEFQSSQSSIIM